MAKYLDLARLQRYDGKLKTFLSSNYQTKMTPVLLAQATSSGNQFVFNVGDPIPQGLMLFTFGNTFTFINTYGIRSGQIYKTAGTFVYNSQGSVITTMVNYSHGEEDLYIWSGNNNYQMVNGFTGYLFLIPLPTS